MASNVFQVNTYQFNNRVIALADVSTKAFPTTGVVAADCIGSPTRSLSTGVNAYSMFTVVATGDRYYCRETFAALVALINA